MAPWRAGPVDQVPGACAAASGRPLAMQTPLNEEPEDLMRTRWLAVTLLAPLTAMAAGTVLQDALRARPSLARGADRFETCASCHGRSGTGTADGAIASIGGQHFEVIVSQLVKFQHGQRWDIHMSHFADQHHVATPQAIADVAAYASSLPRPSWAHAGVGEGDLLPYGAGVYLHRCAGCHGPAAHGDGATGVAQLAGQHFEYLRRQIYNAIDDERAGFTSSHVRLLRQLHQEDIEAVADYLSRLPPRNPGGHRAPADTDGVPP